MIVTVLAVMSIFVILIADQFTKNLAVTALANGSINVITGFLKLTYVENTGAAFGIFRNRKFLLVFVTAALLIYCLYLMISKRSEGPMFLFAMAFVIAGGAGNLIDRIFRGYVVDFFDVTDLFNFAVFNLADCFVVGGVILLSVYILFFEGRSGKSKTKT